MCEQYKLLILIYHITFGLVSQNTGGCESNVS